MDDVTDFPEHRIIPLGESRPYEEGRYRPPSMPAYSGIYPTHMYLNRGKSYDLASAMNEDLFPILAKHFVFLSKFIEVTCNKKQVKNLANYKKKNNK